MQATRLANYSAAGLGLAGQRWRVEVSAIGRLDCQPANSTRPSVRARRISASANASICRST